MKNYIVYETATQKFLRGGCCPDQDFVLQAGPGQTGIEGQMNDVTQKIIDGKIVAKTPEEIAAEKPPAIPEADRPVVITSGQWKALLQRLENLEKA